MLLPSLILAGALLQQAVTAPAEKPPLPLFDFAVRSGAAFYGYEIVNVAPGIHLSKYLTVSPFYAWQTDRNACHLAIGPYQDWGGATCRKGASERGGVELRLRSMQKRWRPIVGFGMAWYKRTGDGIEHVRGSSDDIIRFDPFERPFSLYQEGLLAYVLFGPEYLVSPGFSVGLDLQAGIGDVYHVVLNREAFEPSPNELLYFVGNAGLRLTYYLYH